MSERWNTRRGQDASQAIKMSLSQQPSDTVQMMRDEVIEDSPYQVRRDVEVGDLVEAMRSAGFQGVLIVRAHPDVAKYRRGIVQLAYGHRRRTAWRTVCAERGEPCLLPVIMREYDDEQMLAIGAQENLQRSDLNVVEESDIVRLFQRQHFQKNLGEIAALIGKSENWVRERSRVASMPDPLRDRLRQSSNAVRHFLMLTTLYETQPDTAIQLADMVAKGDMTVAALQQMISDLTTPPAHDSSKNHNRVAQAHDSSEFHNRTISQDSEQHVRTKNHNRVAQAHDSSEFHNHEHQSSILEHSQERTVNDGRNPVEALSRILDNMALFLTDTPIADTERSALLTRLKHLVEILEQ